ncbi:MAG TPA: 16S rRNA (cytosine(1402)-N(4))-methyltransferase RsmH [Alphaproteobacteria bacterium]
MKNVPHIPVMLTEVLDALQPKDGEVYVDGTFGAGGYTNAILKFANCKVIAVDRDERAYATAQSLHKQNANVIPVHGAFGDVADHLQALSIAQVDGLVLDLGVSSMQIDTPERGFSFAKDGPLDMRMDTSSGEPASILVNTLDEKSLADIIHTYGEERHARAIARAIVKARADKQIETTLVLANIVASAMPGSSKKFALHPATRTFQALRIAVNGELEQLESALKASLKVLKPGGRLVIVSFHSLEDAVVKRFLKEQSEAPATSRHRPDVSDAFVPAFTVSVKKALKPTDAECRSNPRASSAKLRFAIRTNDQPIRKAA